MPRPATLMLLTLLVACGDSASSNKKSSTDDDEPRSKKTKTSAKPSGAPSGSPTPPTAAGVDVATLTFVRARPDEPTGVDACAFIGGMGFACANALKEEKDAVARRYMRRMSDADAKQSFDAFMRGEPNGVAHAEVAMMCADGGPCKQKDAEGNELDDGYACLTKAQSMAYEKLPEVAAVHARACKCDHEGAQIPVMGGYLACDGPDKPVARGQNLSAEEAKDVRDCAECNADGGPAACKREIGRLEKSDAELARFIRDRHAPRCARP